jgi:hypothetical protein
MKVIIPSVFWVSSALVALLFILNRNWLLGSRSYLREMHVRFAEMTQLFREIMMVLPPSCLNSAYKQVTGRYLKPLERSYRINDKILSFRCFRYRFIPKAIYKLTIQRLKLSSVYLISRSYRAVNTLHIGYKRHMLCTYNVILRHVHVNVTAVEKHKELL